jgi:GTP-binding protein
MAVTPLVAILGRPNVGKSSLFNRLVGRRQAITHETAGTTRDANYGMVEWSGRHAMLVDTAGMHKSEDELELQAQEQVNAVADVASVLVVVADAGTMITNEDRAVARLALKTGKPVILALNKIDTANGGVADSFERLGVKEAVETSAIHGRGTGDLLDVIFKLTGSAEEPPDEQVTTLAILGRPNVGKSSLMNALLGKQQAIVSSVAGTTRDVSSADIKYHGETIRLLDTAGLRRRGKIEAGIEKYSALRTLAAIAQADICVVVMDATELAVAGDQHIAGQVIEAGKGLVLAVNKWDAVEKETGTQEAITRSLVHDFAFAHWAPLVYTSATQGLNVTKLFEITRQIADRRRTKIATGELNRVIEEMTRRQPPAGLKGKQPKIKYATQTGINPPTFGIHSSYADLIHFSYQRYLENGLRDRYDFTGTPIKLEFKGK